MKSTFRFVCHSQQSKVVSVMCSHCVVFTFVDGLRRRLFRCFPSCCCRTKRGDPTDTPGGGGSAPERCLPNVNKTPTKKKALFPVVHYFSARDFVLPGIHGRRSSVFVEVNFFLFIYFLRKVGDALSPFLLPPLSRTLHCVCLFEGLPP